jgi:hypothetical protein
MVKTTVRSNDDLLLEPAALALPFEGRCGDTNARIML